ncbi:hypothetical protein CRD36_15955 [Paremcibacter congregatus]|uniref:histidine kinase n=2 Tax=Paremcibacter congregatus TaxID=2043170 RepID=A0A2G4YNH5_9PROT|nr:hypothetical protein CRD36_15955 [Paremcibacter congregatus]QDE27550.1 response regulator [Paremcibacter congregatus]
MGGGIKDKYIFVEQVSMLVKQIPAMTGLNFVTAGIIAVILLGDVPNQIPLLWFAGVALYSGVRFWHYSSVKREKITVDNVVSHARFFVGFSFVSGVIWGFIGIVLPISDNPFVLILSATLLCGMVAGSVSYLSIYKPAYYAYAIPCVAPLAIRCLFDGNEMLVAIGILLFLFLGVNLFNSRMAQVNVLKGINLVLENKELIERLRHEKSKADMARSLADDNNEAKSRFLAAASHDLRQPLHAMGFFVEAMMHEKNPVKIQDLVKKVAQTSEALRNLLGSLLDISKIESGGIEPHRTHFILNEILVEIMQEFSEQAKEKGLRLNFKPCSQTVYSDKDMLGRIIRNLISNAVRYTDKGYVNVSWEVESAYVMIHIADSGAGISEADRQDIFREFFQVKGDHQKNGRGLGLGLSIVDGLSRLLDHPLMMHSDVGIGSVFSIRVPQGNLSKVVSETPELNIWSGDTCARTIVLTNEDTSRESISGIMRHWGHQVADFTTIEDALAFLKTDGFDPDLVISDIILRDGSGIEAVAAIEELHGHSLPGIVMTGDGDDRVVEQLRTKGLSVLQKPVQPAKLRSMVTYLVRGEEWQI